MNNPICLDGPRPQISVCGQSYYKGQNYFVFSLWSSARVEGVWTALFRVTKEYPNMPEIIITANTGPVNGDKIFVLVMTEYDSIAANCQGESAQCVCHIRKAFGIKYSRKC